MKKSYFIIAALIFVAACAVYFSFGEKKPEPAETVGGKRISIVATMFPQYDLARAVAKDRADIRMLVKPGAEVHSFEPTPADVVEVRSADIFIENGGAVDSWAEKLLKAADSGSVRIVRFMDAVETLPVEDKEGMEAVSCCHEHDREHGDECSCGHVHDHEAAESDEADEHVWASPANQLKILEAVADAICAADPENCSFYRKNEEEYAEALRKLDAEFRKTAESGKRRLLLFGDRFPLLYFVKEYGLDYRAAYRGCGAHSDVSASTVAYLIDTVRKQGLPAVFCTETSNPAVARTISEQTGVPILVFHSCHNVSLEEFEAGESYVSLMEKNLENVKKGLN
jgi:zinc transport system substrate-binding protein